jgi:hypothetical protein
MTPFKATEKFSFMAGETLVLAKGKGIRGFNNYEIGCQADVPNLFTEGTHTCNSKPTKSIGSMFRCYSHRDLTSEDGD